VQYVAELKHVREVSISGGADFGFWAEHVRGQDLVAVERNGMAQLMIVSASMRYMGVAFSEVTFSLVVANPLDPQMHAVFLISAFNSSRMFAWSERMFFHTPYVHASCDVQLDPPAVRIRRHQTSFFAASMQGEHGAPAQTVESSHWEGAIFLPMKNVSRKRYYFAKLQGSVMTRPFARAHDQLAIQPFPPHAIFKLLLDSNFVPLQWLVRREGVHGRTKTFRGSFPGSGSGGS
jgi:hypothetical protein